jgi:hypothetical protein
MNTLIPVCALSLLAGCFTRASEQYTCIDDSECNGGRVCGESNFCVIPDDGGTGSDGPPGDMADPCMSFGSRHFTACSIPRPTGPMSLTITTSPYIYDTSTGMLLDPNNVPSTPPNMVVPDGRVISVESFSLAANATLRVRGNTPLIIASWGTLEVSGLIDVSSNNAGGGAGALPYTSPSTYCTTHQSATRAENGGGGGGGGGGAMQSNGGAGGNGGGGGDVGGTGAPGSVTPPLLAAGCAGDKGGDGGNNGGQGGLGGGAIQLTARVSISIAASGKIHAGGQGGRQGTGGSGGGGGGGAGGMIGLETVSLTITPGAVLAANGGGGGEGGGNAGGTPGPGQDGQLSLTASNGGTGGSGGDGGSGSVSASAPAGNGGPDGAGGGGGGGGAGFITIKAMTRNDSGAMFSPATPTVVQ